MKILQVCPKYYPSIGDSKMQSYAIGMKLHSRLLSHMKRAEDTHACYNIDANYKLASLVKQ